MATLADLQRAPDEPPRRGPANLPLKVDAVRTFDTPDFAGMTFLEVETKSALNRVKGMGFKWSINPYRGCSHACSYCQSGETPILMADGRTKPLAEVRAGDAIYGTERRGAYRRYVITRVLDHWSTVKPAYRVRLEDGTELITSGDHRFLSDRGWKHVTGSEQGAHRRPHLTTANKLMGTGGFPEPPKPTQEYRRGYLCGMVRGDANLASYAYERAGRRHGNVHRFRLALVDVEALERSRDYLRQEGVEVSEFLFQPASEKRKALRALRDQSRDGVAAIRRIVDWPEDPSAEWSKGFLAGNFDAEGSFSGALRIHNADLEIIAATVGALQRLGLPNVVDPPRPNGCRSVRLVGGLKTVLRFLLTVDPAITRKRSIAGTALKSDAPTRVMAIEPLGMDLPLYDITTGTGDFIANGVVSHNCFARPTHTYLNLSATEDFERTVVVKTNLVEVLGAELAKPSWKHEHVAMGTNTDNYQRCEGRYRLMPGVINALAQARTPFSILTKGTLITRDLAELQAAAQQVPVTAAFTIGMLDEELWRRAEPGTPSPQARLKAVKTLNDAGIPTGVMLAPIMPGLNDDRDQLAALTDAAAAAGATHISPIVLHLRKGVREIFWPWLQHHHPELEDRYAGLYTTSQAAKAYRDEIMAFVHDRRAQAWRRHGRPATPPTWRDDQNEQRPTGHGSDAPASAGEQLRLL